MPLVSQTEIMTLEVPDHVTVGRSCDQIGLNRHVICHVTKRLIWCLDHLITNQMTKSILGLDIRLSQARLDLH